MPTGSAVNRRSPRKQAAEVIIVSNSITGESLGRIGNLSADGMMLISPRLIGEEFVYQVNFTLDDNQHRVFKLEIGMQALWSEAARTPNSFWSGFKFIDISPEDQHLLTDWVASTDQ